MKISPGDLFYSKEMLFNRHNYFHFVLDVSETRVLTMQITYDHIIPPTWLNITESTFENPGWVKISR